MTKRRFPHNTCPASRHVEMLADQLLDSGRSAMIESEPENCAVSMHSTVEALYGARDRIEQLERVLAQALATLKDGDMDMVHATIAAIDEALNNQASG